MIDISDFFQRIENEIDCEISFQDKFRLAQYDNTDGLCYTVGEISKPLDFFIESAKKLHFVQNGDFFSLDDLDIEVPFWGIAKIGSSKDFVDGRYLHEFYYFSPSNSN